MHFSSNCFLCSFINIFLVDLFPYPIEDSNMHDRGTELCTTLKFKSLIKDNSLYIEP